MKLITALEPKITISKNGNERKRKMGLFECPVCLQHIEKDFSNGMKIETCSRSCRIDKGFTTHGMSGTAIYICWNNMRLRCNNSGHKSYKYYGGKGISYPDKWENFEGFFEDMGSSYKEGLTIDRKRKNLNYSKNNCQWIPMEINRVKDRIKSIIQYSMEGKFIASFPSVAEASRNTGFASGSISRAARGERRHANGYVWEYVK